MEPAMLHHHVSTVAQNRQTKCWLFFDLKATIGSPTHLEKGGVKGEWLIIS